MNADPADIEDIWKLLRKHVPEVTSGVVKVLGISRERGSRTVLAVASNDPRGDPVGAVVGHRGERVKRIVSELRGEKVDVVRWEESTERFIANLLAPLRLIEASFDEASREAKIRVVRHSLSHKPDVALHCKLLVDLTGWRLHVDIRDEG